VIISPLSATQTGIFGPFLQGLIHLNAVIKSAFTLRINHMKRLCLFSRNTVNDVTAEVQKHVVRKTTDFQNHSLEESNAADDWYLYEFNHLMTADALFYVSDS
jgi:hypothetical protein